MILSMVFIHVTTLCQINMCERKQDNNIIDIKLTALSEKLVENKPFFVIVSLKNNSTSKINLDYSNAFLLEVASVSEKEKKFLENSFIAYYDLDDKTNYEKKDFLEPGEIFEFTVDITNIKWKPTIQSIDFRKNIFETIKKENYYLHLELPFKFCDNNKSIEERISSNQIEVTF